ncbi:hypothetical protein SRABI80_02367 [Peribacillus frigoritolerans]|nr:hypothetical protein SRABI80_02367 [Peribacillus frigoritolerans]
MKRVDVVYALIYDDITEKVLMVNNHHSTWSLPGTRSSGTLKLSPARSENR